MQHRAPVWVELDLSPTSIPGHAQHQVKREDLPWKTALRRFRLTPSPIEEALPLTMQAFIMQAFIMVASIAVALIVLVFIAVHSCAVAWQ